MSFNVKFSDIAELVMGQSPKGDDCNDIRNGFPLLNGPTEFKERCPSPLQFTTDGKKFSKVGDILFCVRGSTTGRMNYADQVYAIGRGIAAIRGRNGYPTQYVRAVLELNLERLLVAATGSTFPNVGKDLLNNLEVEISSADLAQVATKLIISIEDKKYLNSQTNQTLEEMAQAIFKSWFVDFDPVKAKMRREQPEGMNDETASLFPEKLVESELGLIPEGWEIRTLKSLSEKISKGTTPSKKDLAEATDEASIRFIKVRDINERSEIRRDKLECIPNSVHVGKLKRSILYRKDILFSIAGTIGRVAIVDQDINNVNTNQAVAFVRLKDKDTYMPLVYMTLRENRLQEKAIASIVQGVQANLSLANVGDMEIIVPSENILNLWNQQYSSMLQMIKSNFSQTRELTLLRNTLLPKLLSGEIELGQLDQTEQARSEAI